MNTGIIHRELFASAEMCKGPFVQQQYCVAAARGVKSLSDHVSGAVNLCNAFGLLSVWHINLYGFNYSLEITSKNKSFGSDPLLRN